LFENTTSLQNTILARLDFFLDRFRHSLEMDVVSLDNLAIFEEILCSFAGELEGGFIVGRVEEIRPDATLDNRHRKLHFLIL